MQSFISGAFYFCVILLATVLAYISQFNYFIHLEDRILVYIKKRTLFQPAYKKRKINKLGNDKNNRGYSVFFLFLSFLVLTIPVGIRFETGADFSGYTYYFEALGDVDTRGNLIRGGLEIGYVFINDMCRFLFDNVQSVFIVMAFATNVFMFKGISYEAKKISIGTAVFVYGFSLYFYSYMIIRNMLGIAIAFYSLRFLFESKWIKYLVTISIATTFHYSMSIFFLIGLLYNERYKKWRIFYPLLSLCFLPILPFILKKIGIVAGNISGRFVHYIDSLSQMTIKLGMTVYIAFFWLFLFVVFYRALMKWNNRTSLYFSFYFFSVILSLFAISTPIVTRFIYCLLPALIILLAMIVKLMKKKILIVAFSLFLLLFGLNEIRHIVNEESYELLPYKSIF